MMVIDAYTGLPIADKYGEIKQAVYDRVTTLIGSREDLPEYGSLYPFFWRYNPGQILASIQETLKNDSRVTSITGSINNNEFYVEILADGRTYTVTING